MGGILKLLTTAGILRLSTVALIVYKLTLWRPFELKRLQYPRNALPVMP